VVNSIRTVGEEVTDKPIVKKIQRSLPMRYDANISSFEDRSDLSSLTVDQLHGIFKAYEMRIGNNKSTKDETTFKSSKTKINQKRKTQSCHHEEYDVEEANFIRKIQKVSGKYKGKLPFKCFNCGKLVILHPSVLIPRRTLKRKKTKTINTRRRKNPTTRKSSTEGK
jgi:hypothetical protein